MSADGAEEYLTPEARARVLIDRNLAAAGWIVQRPDRVNLSAGRGVAVMELNYDPYYNGYHTQHTDFYGYCAGTCG